MAPQRSGLHLGGFPLTSRCVNALCLSHLEQVGASVEVAVIRGNGTVVLEILATVLQGGDVTVVVTGIDAGHLSQPVNIGIPVRLRGLKVFVGAEGRDDSTLPGLVIAKELVGGQVVAGVVGGGEEVDLEPLIQRTRLELRRSKTAGDLLIDL